MKELEQAIQTAFAGMVTSGKLTALIEEGVHGAVKSVITGCFNSYSPFQKALAEHINNNLKIDLDGIGLAGYNALLMNIIKAKLDASVVKYAERLISKELDDLLVNPPAEIKLSELVTMLREHSREDDQSGGVSCHVQHSDSSAGWGHVKLDVKPNQSARDCRYDLAYTDKGEVYRIGLPYHDDITKRVFAGPFFGFDRALFQMHAAKTKLIIDEDAVDTGN